MKKEKSLKKNFLMNIVLTMSQFIFPLITFPYISRILSADGVGKVSFAISFVSYFTMFSQLGVPTYGIRVCAKIRDNKEELSKTVHELLIIRLITTTVSYLLFLGCMVFVPKFQTDKGLYWIVSASIFFAFIGVEWLYKALEQYTYITIRSIVFKIIALCSMFMLIRSKDDYVLYGAISIFAASASSLLNFLNLHKLIDFKVHKNYDFRKHLKPIVVFFAMSCATTIYTHLDSVMLGFFATDADVGYYAAAVKIKTILVSVITSLGAVLLPRSSYYIQNNLFDEFKKITQKAYNFVFILSVPLFSYFMLFAEEGIEFLSGKGFQGAVIPMIIIMPTLLFIGLSNTTGMQILVPLGKERIVLYSEIVGAITNLILNFLLIPRYQAIGAAIGTVVAEFCVIIVQVLCAKDLVFPMIKAIKPHKYIFINLLACIMSSWFIGKEYTSLVTLILSASTFFGIYGVVLIILKDKMAIEIVHTVIGKLLRKGKKHV